MKKAAISDSEIKLIVIILALVFLACSFFFGLNKSLSRVKDIEAQNQTIQDEITVLNNMVAKRSATEKETEAYRQKKIAIVEKYPVAIPEEKAIYIVEEMEKASGMQVKTFSYVGNNLVLAGNNGISGYYDTVTLSISGDYNSYKHLLAYIHDSADRMNVENSAVTYDVATGDLSGSMNVRMYYLTGTEKDYEKLPNLNIQSGLTNIFGSN